MIYTNLFSPQKTRKYSIKLYIYIIFSTFFIIYHTQHSVAAPMTPCQKENFTTLQKQLAGNGPFTKSVEKVCQNLKTEFLKLGFLDPNCFCTQAMQTMCKGVPCKVYNSKTFEKHLTGCLLICAGKDHIIKHAQQGLKELSLPSDEGAMATACMSHHHQIKKLGKTKTKNLGKACKTICNSIVNQGQSLHHFTKEKHKAKEALKKKLMDKGWSDEGATQSKCMKDLDKALTQKAEKLEKKKKGRGKGFPLMTQNDYENGFSKVLIKMGKNLPPPPVTEPTDSTSSLPSRDETDSANTSFELRATARSITKTPSDAEDSNIDWNPPNSDTGSGSEDSDFDSEEGTSTSTSLPKTRSLASPPPSSTTTTLTTSTETSPTITPPASPIVTSPPSSPPDTTTTSTPLETTPKTPPKAETPTLMSIPIEPKKASPANLPLFQTNSIQSLRSIFLKETRGMASLLGMIRLTVTSGRLTNSQPVQKNITDTKTVAIKNKMYLTPSRRHYFIDTTMPKVQKKSLFNLISPFRIVLSTNVENAKQQKNNLFTQVGIIANPLSKFRIGLSYSYSKKNIEGSSKVIPQTLIENSKAKIQSNFVSATGAWNVDSPGFTGLVTTIFGWGKMQTTRCITQVDKKICATGSPKTTFWGGDIQFGYTTTVSSLLKKITSSSTTTQNYDAMLLTPYVGLIGIFSDWKSFIEKTSPIALTISRLTTKVFEEHLGLQYRWDIQLSQQTESIHFLSTLELQTWVACIFRQCLKSKISSKSVETMFPLYENSFPNSTKNNIFSELGISLGTHITKNFGVNINGTIRIGKSSNNNLGMRLWYDF